MSTPSYIVQNRFGTYYFRLTIPKQYREKYPGLPKEIRRSLKTNIKKIALIEAKLMWAEFYRMFMGKKELTKIKYDYLIEFSKRKKTLTKFIECKRYSALHRPAKNQSINYSENIDKLALNEREQIKNRIKLEREIQKELDRESEHGSQIDSLPIHNKKLSEVISLYVEEQVGANSWVEKTKQETIACFKLLIDIIGDIPFSSINKAVAISYKETLKKLPKNINNSNKFSEKTILEILSMEEMNKISSKTVNKHLASISGLFNWATRHDYTEKNCFKDIKVLVNSERRKIYNSEDLKLLFENDIFCVRNGKKLKYSYQFWIPLLGLFTGARIEEICQLLVTDIKEQEGIWYFSFEDGEDKRLKNSASQRKVPVNKILIEIGFLEFVKEKRDQSGRIFSELKKVQNKYSHYVSKWFSKYKSKIGIQDSKKVFHSFRHTMINNLKQQLVEKDLRKALVGHAKEDEHDNYGDDFDVKVLKSEIDKLNFKLDNAALKKAAKFYLKKT